ncbi:39S ribosomal protein L24, mitochondrial [Podila humilis]|nr:39S ribosomal protein L24, mitochondrial [Podila humilis]
MLSTTSCIIQLAKAPFKRAQRGLFGGKQIQFGNNVPHSKTKTRRTWLPNVQSKRLFSETLNDWIRINVTTSVIRTVDKKGGLDRYLLETRPELLGERGCDLRSRVVEALKIKQAKKTVANEQQRLGTQSTTLNSSTLSSSSSSSSSTVTGAAQAASNSSSGVVPPPPSASSQTSASASL